jgi:hypothetical protein
MLLVAPQCCGARFARTINLKEIVKEVDNNFAWYYFIFIFLDSNIAFIHVELVQ